MNLNQIKMGVILSYLWMGLGFIVSVICTPIMLRLLGQNEYGLYNFVLSVVSYLSLFSFGFGNAYVRYYSIFKVRDDHESISKLNGMYLIIFTVIGLVTLLVGMILVFNIDVIFGEKFTAEELSLAKAMMAVLVVSQALTFVANVFNLYIISNEKYIFQKSLQVIRTVVNPIVILVVLLLGYGSIGMAVGTSAVSLAVDISNMIFCFKKLDIKFTFGNFDFSLMKEISIFSSYLFINMVIDQINWNVDKFIIGRFRGTADVAIYGVAAQLNMYYTSFSSAVETVFVPRINMMVSSENNNKELVQLMAKVGRIQFIILSLISSGFIFFGKPFINMWAGNGYDEAYVITLLLILPATVPLIQNIGVEIQKAKNMHQFRSYSYLIIAVLSIFVSLILTPRYGGTGAAVSTCLSLLIGNGLLMNLYNHYKVGLDMKYFWRSILSIVPAIILPTITGIFITMFIDLHHIITFLLSGIVYVAVFCISMWFFGMNSFEKELILKPVRAVLSKLNIYLPG